MKSLTCAFGVLLLLAASTAEAQVYVFARNETCGFQWSLHDKDGGESAKKKASKEEGTWYPLLQTDLAGYGAVYCVSEKDGRQPQYFFSEGEATGTAAVEKARGKATDAARGNPKLTVTKLQDFKNLNKHPLRRVNLQ